MKLGDTTDRRLLEALTTMALPASKKALRALILEITRSGFKQMRNDANGCLYGSGTYRFTIPYATLRGASTVDYIQELSDRFKIERAKRDADYGKPKPVEAEPFINPEDLLNDEVEGDLGGDPPGEGASEGSTPSTPAIFFDPAKLTAEEALELAKPQPPGKLVVLPVADAGWEPRTATPALEGSSPSVGTTPNQEEQTTMAKRTDRRGRRLPEPWTCPKCGETFKIQGRHMKACKGPKDDRPASERGRRKRGATVRSAAERPQVPLFSNNGKDHSGGLVSQFREAMTAFTKATADLLTHVEWLEGELIVKGRDSEELAKMKHQLSVFVQPSKVPR